MPKVSFEEALKKLEAIVDELETGNLTLDDSVEKFKEGIELTSFCNKKLDEAEKKITVLIEDNDGRIKEQNFINEGNEV